MKNRDFKMTRLEFVNVLVGDEAELIYELSKKARVCDAKGEKISLRQLMKDLKEKNKKIILHVKRRSMDEIEKILIFRNIPFIRKEHYQVPRVTEGILYNGANMIDIVYDRHGTLMCKNKGVIEAIELLEDDNEMKALVVLNQFAIRDDLENVPRLTYPKQ